MHRYAGAIAGIAGRRAAANAALLTGDRPMSRIAYVDGHYLPHRQAAVHIEDRGYQFADGVYEVIAVRRRPADRRGAASRSGFTARSSELRIPAPMSDAALKIVIREVMRRNGVETGIVYLQVTRGVAPRDHAFPKSAKPALVVTSRREPAARSAPRRGRDRCHHDPRYPLAALRHQIGRAGRQCARQAAGARGRRLRGLAGRRRRARSPRAPRPMPGS